MRGGQGSAMTDSPMAGGDAADDVSNEDRRESTSSYQAGLQPSVWGMKYGCKTDANRPRRGVAGRGGAGRCGVAWSGA